MDLRRVHLEEAIGQNSFSKARLKSELGDNKIYQQQIYNTLIYMKTSIVFIYTHSVYF